ncbi:hypothetical protein BD779DRAFT_1613866 [Infundibulicybe gibba]|nr:hypothetical protein BD779DRAFT_1613866 [Infundibulicybe gibba]
MPASPVKHSSAAPEPSLEDDPLDDWNTGADPGEDDGLQLPPDYVDEPHVRELLDEESPRRARSLADSNPLLQWTSDIDNYMAELLRLEGKGEDVYHTTCLACQIPNTHAIYRCDSCEDVRLLCKGCIEWNGLYFEKITLKQLGLRYQLGHPIGHACPNPSQARDGDFVVIDIDGIHSIALDFCNCHLSSLHYVQLLRARLYPSTTVQPQTAATFRVLESFQLLSFMSKCSAYEFYRTLARRTDNTGTRPLPNRYTPFLRMIRQWRHLKMLKRSGRGNDPTGSSGTQLGECAVLCPSCPHPNINLPTGWETAPNSWIYALFLAMDANFRLKRLNVSSNDKDPGLNRGFAYFVSEKPFKAFLQTYDKKIPDDVSTCSNHDAIKSASARGGKGVAASGVGAVVCSRHNIQRANGVGDLQKGERYPNMDYFYLSTLQQNTPKKLVVSYDIACQWSRNISRRISVYPIALRPHQSNEDITYLVPKFHLAAHNLACQIAFSYNYTPMVARTDGEAPERNWAASNPTSSSTKEMGPGSRRDTLDDHFGDANWKKTTGLVTSYSRKVKEAVAERADHVAAFLDFSASLARETVVEWSEAVRQWESDQTNTNPFEPTLSQITGSKVRLELALEDASDDSPMHIHDDISPSVLISQGLDLEEQQQRLRRDTALMGPHCTDLQRAKMLERSNRLRRRIEAWIEVQHLYMPGVAVFRARENREGSGTEAFNIKLYFPSQDYEARLRFALGHDILHDLRRHILLRAAMWKSKDRFVRGQRENMLEGRISADIARYRANRVALAHLAESLLNPGWLEVLQPLQDADTVSLNSRQTSVGEGRRKMPWIWRVQNTGDGDDATMQEALRIEWCKARARAHRWQEECILLREEMRRVESFFEWQAGVWTSRASLSFSDPITDGGRRAYALGQAALRKTMSARCTAAWQEARELVHDTSFVLVEADDPVE